MTTQIETPSADTEGVNYNASAGEHAEHNPGGDAAHDPNGWGSSQPYGLPFPSGLVGDLAKYFYDTARYPMREGAIFAALGLMAGTAGRAFNFEGTGLNLYMLLLAESGRGKEDMARGIERVLAALRDREMPVIGDDFIGPRKFASGQALNSAICAKPSFLSLQSEFGLRLKELNDPRAPASTSELRLSLLELYAKSGRNDAFRATAYADRKNDTMIVRSPAVTILGESTPGHVFNNLSFGDIEDGLLPRTLLLECKGDRPSTNERAYESPPDALVDRFAMLVNTVNDLDAHSPDPIEPRQIKADPDARFALSAMQEQFDKDFNDKSRDPFDRALGNRAGLNIRRIAALLAVGCIVEPKAKPIIKEAQVSWALDFVTYCVNGLADRFREGMVGTGETRQEAELKRYMVEYVHMKPTKRNGTYSVPQKLADESAFITLGYLRRRAKQCTAFTQDRRGFNVALHSTIEALVRVGVVSRLGPQPTLERFGLTCEVYCFSNGEAMHGWCEARRPRR